MNEGLPSQNALDKMKLEQEGAVAEAESLGEEILETEQQLVAALKEAEDLAKQIETLAAERKANPVAADLADTEDDIAQLQGLHEANKKFIAPLSAVISGVLLNYTHSEISDGNYFQGVGTAAGSAVLIYSTLKLIREGFKNLQESKLRADLLQEVLNQQT